MNKYNIGDMVFFSILVFVEGLPGIYRGKIISINLNENNIEYMVQTDSKNYELDENSLYKEPKELLQHLHQKIDSLYSDMLDREFKKGEPNNEI